MGKGMFDGIRDLAEGAGLVTPDHSAPVKVAAKSPTQVSPQTSPYPPQPTGYAPTSYTAPAPFVQPSTLTPEDEARKQEIAQRVYAVPSNYVSFQRIRESLDNTNDVAKIVKVMQAANQSLTVPKILADIDQHLGIIDSTVSDMDSAVKEAKASRLDDPTHDITTHQQAIQQAQEAITRAQADIEARKAKITEIQNNIAAASQKIADGEAHFKIVIDQLRQPLLQTKQLLSNLS